VALFTAEAEYIAAGVCCAQILYMKQTSCKLPCHIKCIHIRCLSNHGKIVMSMGLARGGGLLVLL